jgi:hypothetical protein
MTVTCLHKKSDRPFRSFLVATIAESRRTIKTVAVTKTTQATFGSGIHVDTTVHIGMFN